MKSISSFTVSVCFMITGCTAACIGPDPGIQDSSQNTDSTDVDTDGDGIPDYRDNCRTVPNPLQNNAEADEFGDACDNCPTDPIRHDPSVFSPCAPPVQPDAGRTEPDAGPPAQNACVSDTDCSAGERCNAEDHCVIPCHRDIDCNNPDLWCGQPEIKNDPAYGTCTVRPAGSDAGMQTDAGVIQDPRCADYMGNPVKAYVVMAGPYDYEFGDGRQGARTRDFFVQVCDETIEVNVFTLQLNQRDESQQTPQNPDDATGLLLQNGVPAFSNAVVSNLNGGPITPQSQSQTDARDDSTLTYLHPQSIITLEPRAFRGFSVTMDIAENPELAGTTQLFHILPGLFYRSATYPNGQVAIPLVVYDEPWPTLTVRYGQQPDAGTQTPDAGTLADAGAIQDPQCQANPRGMYVSFSDPINVTFREGRPNSAVLRLRVNACAAEVAMSQFAVYLTQTDEENQDPQNMDDATGFFIGPNTRAFSNPRLRYTYNPSFGPDVTSIGYASESDAYERIYFALESPQNLQPFTGIEMELMLDIADNPGFETGFQSFQMVGSVAFTTQAGCEGVCWAGSTQWPHNAWPMLTVQYGESSDAGVQTPDAGPNPANVRVIGASAAPPSGDLHPGEQDVAFDQFDVSANQPVSIVSISYTFFRIWGASGLLNQGTGNHVLLGTRIHSDNFNVDLLNRGKDIHFYGENCYIDLVSEQFTGECSGIGPLQELDIQSGYTLLHQISTYVSVSTQATAADSYIPTVTGVRYKMQGDDTVYSAPARLEGNLRRVSVP